MTWVKSGPNWMMTAWVGDAQVVYLVEPLHHRVTRHEFWGVIKKVSGAVARNGYMIDMAEDLEQAKALAEWDATQPI